MGQPYTRTFFETFEDVARAAAHVVMPIVLDLVRPSSVIDVGCGEGIWLEVCRTLGIENVTGLDGAYVASDLRRVANFIEADLAWPLHAVGTFDLAISLEVAEHLPHARGASFVADLTALAPVVLFSAAIPFQGGNRHVNERWQDEWAAEFARHDYLPIDAIRPAVWTDRRVKWYYAQNTILYARRTTIDSQVRLAEAYARTKGAPIRVVHPTK